MHVDEVELRVIRLPYKSVFKTSFAAESEKVAVIATVRSDGSVRGQLSVASEGPCLTEVGGGVGGEPDGRSAPIYRVSWD